MIQEKYFIENGITFKEVVRACSFIYRYATRVHQFAMNGMSALVSNYADACQRSIVAAEIKRHWRIVSRDRCACMSAMASSGEIKATVCRSKESGKTPDVIRSKRVKRIKNELFCIRQGDLWRRRIREILLG